MANCEGCERKHKRSGECLVFKQVPKKCWAHTTDPDWGKKVKEAIARYRNMR